MQEWSLCDDDDFLGKKKSFTWEEIKTRFAGRAKFSLRIFIFQLTSYFSFFRPINQLSANVQVHIRVLRRIWDEIRQHSTTYSNSIIQRKCWNFINFLRFPAQSCSRLLSRGKTKCAQREKLRKFIYKELKKLDTAMPSRGSRALFTIATTTAHSPRSFLFTASTLSLDSKKRIYSLCTHGKNYEIAMQHRLIYALRLAFLMMFTREIFSVFFFSRLLVQVKFRGEMKEAHQCKKKT